MSPAAPVSEPDTAVPLRAGPAALLALASGAAYAAAQPPIGLWPLGWIALAPLFVAAARRPVAHGAALGALCGSVAAVGTSPWLPAMIGDYFEASAAVVWPLAVAVWVLAGVVYFVALGAWLAWSTSIGPVSPFVVAAAAWVLEWARAHAPIPNPWALLGASQMGWLPAVQVADLFGPHGVGAVLVVAGASLAGLVEPRLLGRARRRTALVAGAVVASALVYGLVRMATLPSEPASLRVGVVQAAIARDHRYAREHLGDNLAAHLALTRRAVDAGAELVVWPELALDFYVEREATLRRHLVAGVRDVDVPLLAGGLGVARRGDVDAPTNSVFLVTPQGVQDRADKVRLMVFSESRPFSFLELGSDRLVAGRAPKLLRVHDVAIGSAICSEAMQPDYVRDVVGAGAQLILVPSIDGWFGTEGGARQQLASTAMRAIETRRYLVRATATGVSAVIDPAGRLLAETPLDEPAVRVADVEPRRGLTLYARIGESGTWLAFATVAGDALRRLRRRRADEAGSPAQPGSA